MLDQIKGMKENLQKKLDSMTVEGESGGGRVRVIANGNQVVTNVTIVDSLLAPENSEELEDLLITAFNRATEEAKMKAGEEAQNMMSGIIPPGMNLPDLF